MNHIRMILTLCFLELGTAFMDYVLLNGQASFWGVAAITNLVSRIPYLVEWLSGGHDVCNTQH